MRETQRPQRPLNGDFGERSRARCLRSIARYCFSVVFVVSVFPALTHAQQEEKYPPDRKPEEIAPKRAGPSEPLKYFPPPLDPAQVPHPPPSARREMLPVPDRWRLMQALGVRTPWYDPYNQNVLKGDLPISQEPWFREHFPALAQKLSPDWFLNL